MKNSCNFGLTQSTGQFSFFYAYISAGQIELNSLSENGTAEEKNVIYKLGIKMGVSLRVAR